MIILCLAIGALVAYAIYQEQKKVHIYTSTCACVVLYTASLSDPRI